MPYEFLDISVTINYLKMQATFIETEELNARFFFIKDNFFFINIIVNICNR